MMTSREAIEVIPVPLTEAVIEVRFPVEADVERIRGAFQSTVLEHYPDLFVPSVVAGESVATMPYVFSRGDRSQAVLLSVNLLGYVVRSYPGWDRFREGFLDHWRHLTELVPITRATRVALRYANRFDGQLAEVVRRSDPPPFLMPLRLDTLRHEASTRYRTQRGHSAQVHVQWEEGDAGLSLDFDVALDGLADVGRLGDVLDHLHDDVEALFQASVEPRFASDLGVRLEEPTAARLEPVDVDTCAVDAGGVDAAERIARSTFPAASRFNWSDDVDEIGTPYSLMSVVSPGSSHEIHEAYLAFVRTWVREEPPERRSQIRVAYRAGRVW